ncbi:2-succinyl-6-hydroxy-2,4-cyclohexadiene-1-carboxylate synthase [Chromobacterium sp. ATCC 53434]|uniref:alpha/beta fold hydrolase n=1 Tax=Chromobacterium TaxID=535 RepID=UPI000C76D71A|nr:alpha/beta fold hydrolase [Chromobacterium sp. ATCC 53434]AUH50564.1 2-succinyl-6-hydroxy-2,4-cyclohexadiene-1-carboxylate synthase [Chromobacterium sp. ATCC 53434]
MNTMDFVDTGSGFPVLLGHSYLFDRRMWQPQVQALAQRYRVIIPDLWGHGRSPQLADGHADLERLADDHMALMDRLGIKRFAVAGLSVGGMWGAELAAKYPERVAALVLLDTFVGAETPETRDGYFQMLDIVEEAGAIPPPLQERIAALFYSPRVPRLTLQRLIDRLAALSAGTLRQSVLPLGRLIFGRPDRLERLRRIQCPSLVMTGEQDRPRPPSEGRLMADILGCRFVEVPDAGHISNEENPAFVTDTLLEFLNRNLRG